MQVLDAWRSFLSDIRRIREALERLSPPKAPPDPRRKPHDLYKQRQIEK